MISVTCPDIIIEDLLCFYPCALTPTLICRPTVSRSCHICRRLQSEPDLSRFLFNNIGVMAGELVNGTCKHPETTDYFAAKYQKDGYSEIKE